MARLLLWSVAEEVILTVFHHQNNFPYPDLHWYPQLSEKESVAWERRKVVCYEKSCGEMFSSGFAAMLVNWSHKIYAQRSARVEERSFVVERHSPKIAPAPSQMKKYIKPLKSTCAKVLTPLL